VTHGVSHSPELLRVPAGGACAPLVQIVEEVRLFLLDGTDTKGARRTQDVHHQAAGSGLIGARRDPPPVHSGNHSGRQRGPGGGKGGTRACLHGAMIGLLHQ
jgi:hypothetical protein